MRSSTLDSSMTSSSFNNNPNHGDLNLIELSKSIVVRVDDDEIVSSEIEPKAWNSDKSNKNESLDVDGLKKEKEQWLAPCWKPVKTSESKSNNYGPTGKRYGNKLEGSRLFTLQAIIVWCLLCLPGYLVTIVLYTRISKKNITSSPDKELESWRNQSTQNDFESGANGFASEDYRKTIEDNCRKDYSGDETENCLDRFFNFEELVNLCADFADDPLSECLSKEMKRFLNASSFSSTSRPLCYESQRSYNHVIRAAKFWIEGVAIVIIGIFGLCGNFITIAVLQGMEANRNFNKLLMGLAVVDSLLILDLIVENSIINSLMLPGSLPFWYRIGYPYFFHPTKGMIQTGSIFMVVAISAERHKAVCHPLSYRQAPHKFILFVVLITITMEFPRFFQFRLVTNSTDFFATDFWTTDLMEDPDYIQFSSYWDEMITTGAVPLISLIYFNAKMILKIRASSRFSHRFVGSTAQKRSATLTNEMPPVSQNLSIVSENSPPKEGKSSNGVSSRAFSLKRVCHRNSSEKKKRRRSSVFLSNTQQREGHFRRRREKSTLILVAIVLIFIACHSYRLALKVYEAAHPENNTAEHYAHCQRQNRYHVPFIIYILFNLNYLFLVLNSSTNFIIYCVVVKEFRTKVVKLLCRN